MASRRGQVGCRTLAIASAVLLASACSRGPAPIHVTSVRAADGASAGPLREAGLDLDALEASAREGLAAAGFALGQGSRPHRVRVDLLAVRFAPAQAGVAARVEVTVELELVPAEEGPGTSARESGTGSATLAGPRPADAWRSALALAARRAADGLGQAAAASTRPVPQVIRDLDASDPRQRARAVQALADRRATEAVPALVKRLDDPDAEVAQLAVGALAQLRDPRAVGPLIELSGRGDAAFTARLARIIGDVGGREAEGYLLTLASGHPEPAVRTAAREALEDLRARAREAGPVAGK
jgi:hypothetical protein